MENQQMCNITVLNFDYYKNDQNEIEKYKKEIEYLQSLSINDIKKGGTIKISTDIMPLINIKRTITISKIINVVCEYVNTYYYFFEAKYSLSKYKKLDKNIIQLKTRDRNVVVARQISMYFSKKLTKHSLTKIGQEIGGKDHATVLYACNTINNLIETDKNFKKHIESIENKIKNVNYLDNLIIR